MRRVLSRCWRNAGQAKAWRPATRRGGSGTSRSPSGGRHQPLRYDWSDDVIKPQYVIQEISNLTRGEAMIVTDVGQHQMWAAQLIDWFSSRARSITSGGAGTMGFGCQQPWV